MNGCINEFCFSPCGLLLAIVSQDGFLRVFDYDKMELLGVARSYFGGFLCVCWSPDGKYIVVGGEDDLVTVWSLHERRVVARGQGHRSWVSVVAFDPFTSFSQWDGPDFSDDENPTDGCGGYRNYNNDSQNDVDYESNPVTNTAKRPRSASVRDSSLVPDKLSTSYRLGSVSQDTQLCLWDITEDVLRQSYEIRHRLSSYDASPMMMNGDAVEINGTSVSNGYADQLHTSAAGNQSNDSKVINPTASGSGVQPPKEAAVDNYSNSKNSSNSSSKSGSKFATANCTSGSSESGRSSIVDQAATVPNSGNRHSSSKTNTLTIGTAGGSTKTNVIGNNSDTPPTVGDTSKSSISSKSSEAPASTTFNSITQRLSNFSFGNDKRKDGEQKKSFTFSKSTGNHAVGGIIQHANQSNMETSVTSIKNGKPSAPDSVISSYDPMRLIGTTACPRFDECPLLEPLVCKKIAHERLTALIFREDCFLTACQDGFIYTWARPGFSVSS